MSAVQSRITLQWKSRLQLLRKKWPLNPGKLVQMIPQSYCRRRSLQGRGKRVRRARRNVGQLFFAVVPTNWFIAVLVFYWRLEEMSGKRQFPAVKVSQAIMYWVQKLRRHLRTRKTALGSVLSCHSFLSLKVENQLP